eukprot:TRINITY_DN28257_c0_g1_i1.p1 TRINITY_DN28257_c0_g1~~TRINITY_DN28257_c0_g1_i1.p1  ORF type:complete len:240 (+),score=91.55 TRINITY_DN28257_c0_g1_i1:52-771(+)
MRRAVKKVVFIPGALNTAKAWAPVADTVRAAREGLDVSVAPAVVHAECVREAAQYIEDEVGFVRGGTVVVGHSFGGYIALEVAKRYGQDVVGLGLLSSQAREDHEKVSATRRKLVDIARTSGIEKVVELQRNLLLHSSNQHLLPELQQMAEDVGVEGFVKQQALSIARPDSSPFLKATATPIWLCSGDDDSLLPILVQKGIHQEAQRCTLDIVPNVGHMAHIEAPDAVANLFLDWLDSL